jgi:protein SCO1/2
MTETVALPADALPEQLKDVGIDQNLNARVTPDLAFRDESGTPVHLSQYFKGKPVVLALVYDQCPMLCNLVMNGTLRGLRAVSLDAGSDFDVVFVSIDPRETPSQAAARHKEFTGKYKRSGSERGWHFLTGQEHEIRKLAAEVGFRYTFDATNGQYNHASAIMILTPEGRLARYFYGVEYSARDLKFGIMEAASNRIGSPVDKIMLYCFHYDPATGKYGVVIMNVIRLLGAATVVLLAAFVIVQLRRDHSRRRVERMA